MPVYNKKDHWDNEYERLHPNRHAIRIDTLEELKRINELPNDLTVEEIFKFLTSPTVPQYS